MLLQFIWDCLPKMHGLIIAKLKPNKIIAKRLAGNAVLWIKSDRLDRDWCVSCKVSKASSQTWIKPRVQSGLQITIGRIWSIGKFSCPGPSNQLFLWSIVFFCCQKLIITIRPQVLVCCTLQTMPQPHKQHPNTSRLLIARPTKQSEH